MGNLCIYLIDFFTTDKQSCSCFVSIKPCCCTPHNWQLVMIMICLTLTICPRSPSVINHNPSPVDSCKSCQGILFQDNETRDWNSCSALSQGLEIPNPLLTLHCLHFSRNCHQVEISQNKNSDKCKYSCRKSLNK